MSKLARQYLVYTFAIMFACWGTCLLCSLSGLYMTQFPVLFVPYLLGGFSPTIASYLAARKSGSVKNVKEWLKSVFDVKHNLLSYLLIPVLAGVFFLCLCTVCGYTSGAPLFAIVFMIPMMLFGGGLEETGWRGILQPELEKKFGYTAATVFVAIIWWLWHYPLFHIVGVGQYGTDFLAFGINVIGLSFALSAIKKITASTFLCVLFHCLINSLHSVFVVENGMLGNCIAAAALIVFSYFLIWLQKKLRVFS